MRSKLICSPGESQELSVCSSIHAHTLDSEIGEATTTYLSAGSPPLLESVARGVVCSESLGLLLSTLTDGPHLLQYDRGVL